MTDWKNKISDRLKQSLVFQTLDSNLTEAGEPLACHVDIRFIELGYHQKGITTTKLLFATHSQAQRKTVLKQPVDYVNPLIRTSPPTDKKFLGNNPVVGEELYYGCVSPAAIAVDPVVKLGSNTGFDGIFHVRDASYSYTDSSIMGFTHLQHEYNQMANILFMPTVGSIQTIPGSRQHPDSDYRSDGRAGQFIIEAHHPSDQNIYVQSVSLNGKTLVEPIFHDSQIVPGGKLIFEMGPTPNKKWGSK